MTEQLLLIGTTPGAEGQGSAIVSMIPTIVLGLLLERYIVRGLTAGAIK